MSVQDELYFLDENYRLVKLDRGHPTALKEPEKNPETDCTCGGEKTGYPKGNVGHAHWCAWRTK